MLITGKAVEVLSNISTEFHTCFDIFVEISYMSKWTYAYRLLALSFLSLYLASYFKQT